MILYLSGLSLATIGNIVGVSAQSVMRWARLLRDGFRCEKSSSTMPEEFNTSDIAPFRLGESAGHNARASFRRKCGNHRAKTLNRRDSVQFRSPLLIPPGIPEKQLPSQKPPRSTSLEGLREYVRRNLYRAVLLPQLFPTAFPGILPENCREEGYIPYPVRNVPKYGKSACRTDPRFHTLKRTGDRPSGHQAGCGQLRLFAEKSSSLIRCGIHTDDMRRSVSAAWESRSVPPEQSGILQNEIFRTKASSEQPFGSQQYLRNTSRIPPGLCCGTTYECRGKAPV